MDLAGRGLIERPQRPLEGFFQKKTTTWSDIFLPLKNFVFLVKITQNRAGARHRGSDPSDSTRRPQERYGLNLAGRGLSERPQRDLGGNFRWPTRPGRPAERRSEALINWMDGWWTP